VPARLDRYIETDKQRRFSRDFLAGWEDYETWEVPQGEVGEVHVSGDILLKEYFKNPEATAAARGSDGFPHARGDGPL
jgi:acyl-CoA synthetase (AMP-forming)/AMP-acid ligase II